VRPPGMARASRGARRPAPWNLPAVAPPLEAAFLFGGSALYFRLSRPVASGRTWGFLIFAVTPVWMQTFIFFGAPQGSPEEAAVTALGAYALLAVIAGWLERKRAPDVGVE
jgi:hypothetical protein